VTALLVPVLWLLATATLAFSAIYHADELRGIVYAVMALVAVQLGRD
jgi:hypothetical protein